MTQFQRLLGHALAVRELDPAVAAFERIGLTLGSRAADPARGTTTARFPFADGGYLDLVTVDDASAAADVEAFLAGGDGLWRMDVAVDDLAGLARLAGEADGAAEGDGPDVRLGPLTEDAHGALCCEVSFADPAAVGGARFALVDAATAPPPSGVDTWWKRIFTQAVAVPSVDRAVLAFERLGQPLWDRSGREDWGLDTAVFRQATGSNVEFVSPTDETRPTGGAIAAFLARRGGGHYMPVYEVDDIDRVFAELEARGVRTLGPPAAAPPESPWGPVRQMWVHPKLTHGAFVEFLSVAL